MITSLLRQRAGALMSLWVIAALQVGCSGGGEIVAGGGIGGTGVTVVSVGTVTGFGSVIVNGVAFDTTGAEVFVENLSKGTGNSAVLQHLSAGMVVRVEGSFAEDGSASADRVFFSNYLKGVVESISELDSISKQAVILGQTILINDRTVFHNVNPVSIAAGMVLEVSGYDDDLGRIFATYVNKVADSLPLDGRVEIKGVVQDVIPPLQSFKIRQLTVDYSGADLGGLGGNALEAGQLVKIIGRPETPNQLVAESIDLEEEFGSRAFDVVDLEGIITQAGAPGEFGIGRYTIRVDQATSFINLTPQDLNPGTRVVVHGALTDRVILAAQILLPERIRIESNVSSIDFDNKSLVLEGLEPARVFATETTRILGIESVFDDIAPGNHVRVLGRRTGSDILASSIVVTPTNDSVNLAGPVDTVSQPIIVILGIEVDTSLIPSDEFKGVGGKPVSSGEFFGTLRPADSVVVEGVLQAGTVNWLTISLE
ncbi:MAG: DUF5666 domain-containing protein [Candidatus Desulfacyla sp.]